MTKGILIGSFAAFLANALLSGCSQPKRQDSYSNRNENEIARGLLATRAEMTAPWRATKLAGNRVYFGAVFKLALDSSTDPGASISAVVIAKNSRVPKQRYDELARAVGRAGARLGSKDEATALAPLDMGGNVASVYFIGPAEEALHCEIIGFHMPTLMGQCDWAYDGTSFHVQGDPRLMASAIHSRRRLEAAWSKASEKSFAKEFASKKASNPPS